jgi:diaminopimelate epimerase
VSFPFVKGHGTRNDFLLLPDLDGAIHGELAPSVVVALCDRRSGVGADGVLRVLRSAGRPAHEGGADWFMDYRNADGSLSEMCGNGVRVFARYLQKAGLVDDSSPVAIDTRDGVKTATFCDDGAISVGMGRAVVGPRVRVSVDGRTYDALAVDVGNPHAVVVVDSLTEAGSLTEPPGVDAADFPQGVNVEFVVVQGSDLAMRVYERGVGETESCGTGACAVAVAAAAGREAAGRGFTGPALLPMTYTVRVPGGALTVALASDGTVHLKGPAELVAEGTWTG